MSISKNCDLTPIFKVTNTGATQRFVYHYDMQGNLIAETRPNGTLVRLYVWADGEPLAQIQNRPALATEELAYLHTDHLHTARLATDATKSVVWRFESEAFGTGKPDTDPDGDDAATNVRLRFPGQYHDGESGLYYNWHRYYDPKIGRYITSDPIGLAGGPNTYGYVGGNPLYWSDRTGLVEDWMPGDQPLDPGPRAHFLPKWIPTGDPNYPNWVLPTNQWGFPTGLYPGRTEPNNERPKCDKGCPEILPGTYPFTWGMFPRNLPYPGFSRYPALSLGEVPTREPNPNNRDKQSMVGAWAHKGPGSEGCLTIHPDYWDAFMKNYSQGSRGHVTVW